MSTINNEFYDTLGESWYVSDDHAVALLRRESAQKFKYIEEQFALNKVPQGGRVLDIACGAGFVGIPLAEAGYQVVGVDQSAGSLAVAARHSPVGVDVTWERGDALSLKFADDSFDAVLLLDCLEHFEAPEIALQEAVRVLRRGGVLIYHTFNRSPLAWFFGVYALEVLTKNSPKDIHLYRLFIKPEEMLAHFANLGLSAVDLRGLRPCWFSKAFWRALWRRRIDDEFCFEYTKSKALAYLGTGVLV